MMEITILILIEFLLRMSIFLGFFVLFLIMLWQRRRVATHSLTLQQAVTAGMVAMAVYVIDFITYTAWQDDQLRIYLHLILFTTVSFMYYSWYRHYESFTSIHPPLKRHLPIFYLLSIESGIAMLEFIGLVKETYIMSVVSHLAFIIGILSFSTAWKILRRTHFVVQEYSTRLEFIAINVILIGNLTFFVEDILATVSLRYTVIPEVLRHYLFLLANIISIIGLLILIGNYVLHPDYIFRIPIPIHAILMYNKHGILTYHRNVKSPTVSAQHFRAELFSGIISSIKTMFDQMIGIKLAVTSIVAENYRIILQSLPSNVGTIVLITSGESTLLQQSLDRFITMIDDKTLKMIERDVIKAKEISAVLDPLVIKAFPYLTFID